MKRTFWIKHKASILYHLRSIGDSFAAGVIYYIITDWNNFTISVSNLEYSAIFGIGAAALRSGWKLASRPAFDLLKGILKWMGTQPQKNKT